MCKCECTLPHERVECTDTEKRKEKDTHTSPQSRHPQPALRHIGTGRANKETHTMTHTTRNDLHTSTRTQDRSQKKTHHACRRTMKKARSPFTTRRHMSLLARCLSTSISSHSPMLMCVSVYFGACTPCTLPQRSKKWKREKEKTKNKH